jgi:hypothetical protein
MLLLTEQVPSHIILTKTKTSVVHHEHKEDIDAVKTSDAAGPEDADVDDEVAPAETEDADAEDPNEDAAPAEQNDVDAEEANDGEVSEENKPEESTEDVAPEETTEQANVDDDDASGEDKGGVIGSISSYYLYYVGFGLIVLVGTICVCVKKTDGYTEITP